MLGSGWKDAASGVDLANVLAAILAGAGIAIDRSDPSRITIRATGGTTPGTHASYVGTSADSTVSEAEALAGTSGTGNALPIPAYAGEMHVFYLRPATAGAITVVYLYQPGHRNTQNQRTAFEAVNVTVNGTAYVGVVSRDALNGAGGRIMEVA